jgi:hypothetical protein
MKRYFFYLVLINSVANIVIFLAKFLVPNHNEGSLIAIILSIPFGTVLIYFFSKALIKFPNKNFLEILQVSLPYWLQVIIMLLFSPAWYISGILMLSGTIDITEVFIDPQASSYLILIAYVSLIIFSINTEGSTILYGLEIFMFFIFPALIFAYVKAIVNPFFSWDACMETITHSFKVPNLSIFAVTTYNFSGYTDMIAYNRDFKGKFELKHLWLFPVIIFILQVFTLFIPIAFLGTANSSNFNFPWLAAADSMVLKTGVIERMLFIYLLIYLVTALVNVIVHWYVSFELFKELLLNLFRFKKVKACNIGVLCLFAVGSFLYILFVTQENRLAIVEIWLTIRVFLEVFLVILLNYIAHKAQKKGEI